MALRLVSLVLCLLLGLAQPLGQAQVVSAVGRRPARGTQLEAYLNDLAGDGAPTRPRRPPPTHLRLLASP